MKKIFLTWDNIDDKIVELEKWLLGTEFIRQADEDQIVNFFGVPRGGIPVAVKLVASLESNLFITPRLTSNPEEAHFIIDDIECTGKTKEFWTKKCPKAEFLSLYEQPADGTWIVFPWEIGTEDLGPEENIRRLIEFIGDDPAREGLTETPARVLKSYQKLFGGYHANVETVLKTFEEGACDSMVILKNIEFYSTCEHHMLPFFGKCSIGYIPNGKVVGVSKLARLMEIFARRMQIQERIGQQITAALMKHLSPKGAICVIEAQHFCMTSRGVEKQNSVMVTSSITGEFNNAEVRAEFFSLIKE